MIRSLKFFKNYRGFRKLPAKKRRIVFYSESGQDWHHFEPVIKELTGRCGATVCYVTSDPEDPGLAGGNPLLHGFCIGGGLLRILFFQFLKADILILTMVDLDNFHIKRSIHPVHYVFMFHSLISAHMADFENSYDHYDSILCAGPHQMKEIQRREELADLKPKHLVAHGYHRLEQLFARQEKKLQHGVKEPVHVLLAPSWGEQTILNTCGEALVRVLLDAGFKVTLRPHYQTHIVTPDVVDRILDRFSDHEHFRFVDRMAEDDSLFDSDLMITDWSGAGMDYGLGLEKPVLYIDLPPKTRNDSWPDLGIEPFEIMVRTKIGALLSPDCLSDAPATIRRLLAQPQTFQIDVSQLRQDWVFNFGHSSEAAADAIVDLAARLVPRETDG
jgi:YidC/Oxa1 family membrane protein insertase